MPLFASIHGAGWGRGGGRVVGAGTSRPASRSSCGRQRRGEAVMGSTSAIRRVITTIGRRTIRAKRTAHRIAACGLARGIRGDGSPLGRYFVGVSLLKLVVQSAKRLKIAHRPGGVN